MPNCRTTAALLALLATTAARAASPLPPTAADLTGARAAALGAYRGLAGGNDEIFLNPAALAARRRYSIETHWILERAGGANAGQFLTVSTVDSQSGGVAGGFAYTRLVSGPSIGSALHLALATAVSSRVFAGVTGKYLTLSGAESVRAATVDAGLFVPLGRLVSVGVAGYNLVPVNHDAQAPRAVGAGIAVGDERRFNLTADWRSDFDRRGRRTNAYGGGVEVLVGEYFPVRAGWLRDDTRDGRWWSAGLGAVTTAGGALDLTYRQSTSNAADRTFGVALKLFILQ